ncbi:hypothetical protein A2U01_0119295, partial [Trifolium medium]|nr:hypothetical protein [Trifolium medium]
MNLARRESSLSLTGAHCDSPDPGKVSDLSRQELASSR